MIEYFEHVANILRKISVVDRQVKCQKTRPRPICFTIINNRTLFASKTTQESELAQAGSGQEKRQSELAKLSDAIGLIARERCPNKI